MYVTFWWICIPDQFAASLRRSADLFQTHDNMIRSNPILELIALSKFVSVFVFVFVFVWWYHLSHHILLLKLIASSNFSTKVGLSQRLPVALLIFVIWNKILWTCLNHTLLFLRWKGQVTRAKRSRHIFRWGSPSSTCTRSTPTARWPSRTSTWTSTRVRSPPSSVTMERGRQRQCKRLMVFQ